MAGHPVLPAGRPVIDLTTGLGYPKKAEDARSNPHVSLLFSDPTGSGLERPPAVLVQGTAIVDDADLDANRERYGRESVEKLPATKAMHPPEFIQRFLSWYYTRIYVHVRPERVYVWPEGDFTREPQLFGSHMEEVRSGHSEEPEVPRRPRSAARRRGTSACASWAPLRDGCMSMMAPDGFPMSARVPIEPDEAASRIRITEVPVGLPLAPGRACLTAHEHEPEFKWQVNFQVRGNLLPDNGGWLLVPRRLVGGSSFHRHRRSSATASSTQDHALPPERQAAAQETRR